MVCALEITKREVLLVPNLSSKGLVVNVMTVLIQLLGSHEVAFRNSEFHFRQTFLLGKRGQRL